MTMDAAEKMPRFTMSIGTRLTVWYAFALGAGLFLFAMGIWWFMQGSLRRDVDHDLALRITSLSAFLSDELKDTHVVLSEELIEYSHAFPEGTAVYLQSEIPAGSPAKIVVFNSRPEFPWNAVKSAEAIDTFWRGTSYRTLTKNISTAGIGWHVTFITSLEEVDTLLNRLRLVLLLLSPVVLLTAALGGRWLSRQALKPVDELTAAAREIGIQNLSRRLDVPQTGDELQRLSETFNAMLERLESAVGRLSRFTADASHELRTPLAVIRSTAEIASRQLRPAEQYRHALQQVVWESEQMTSLIDDLLFLARTDTALLDLPMQVLRLDEIVEDACRSLRQVADKKAVRLTTSMPQDAALVWGNSSFLRRLVIAIIDNAFKYTDSGGLVTVSLQRVQKGSERVTLSVIDQGPGIPENELPYIFDRFYRGLFATENRKEGAGLGLSLASAIARLHDTEIRVTSRVGQGSSFEVDLPVNESRRLTSCAVNSQPALVRPVAGL